MEPTILEPKPKITAKPKENFFSRNGYLIFAILYLLFPVDILPDVPFIGYLDDTAIFIVELIRREIIARKEQANTPSQTE